MIFELLEVVSLFSGSPDKPTIFTAESAPVPIAPELTSTFDIPLIAVSYTHLRAHET